MTARIAQALDDPITLAGAAWLTLTPTSTAGHSLRADGTAVLLRKRDRTAVRALITRLILHPTRIDIELATTALAEALQLELELAAHAPTSVTLTAEVTLTRTGHAMRLVHDNGVAAQSPPARPSSSCWSRRGAGGRPCARANLISPRSLTAEGVQPAYITRVVSGRSCK